MLRAWILVALAACGASTSVEFTPRDRSAALPPAIVERAALAFQDDAALLAAAGAVILGSLELAGSTTAEPAELRTSAAVEGARRGGTHVLIAVERTDEEWDQITADGTRRWADGNQIRSQPTEGTTIAHETARGLFIVIRVPPERWPELPAPLRPR